jgi:hypothetical protein
MAKISKMLVLLSLIVLSFQRRCTLKDERRCERLGIEKCYSFFGCSVEGLHPAIHCSDNDYEYECCCDIVDGLPCAKTGEDGWAICDKADSRLCPIKRHDLEFLE